MSYPMIILVYAELTGAGQACGFTGILQLPDPCTRELIVCTLRHTSMWLESR
jgi:hypothetical protein